MTLNPTAVAPNPRYRGAKASGERDAGERIRHRNGRSESGREESTTGDQGEMYRVYEEERRGERPRERKRTIGTPPWRESTVPEINTPASCDHSSCHAPLLSPHIRRLSRSFSFIPLFPSCFPSHSFPPFALVRRLLLSFSFISTNSLLLHSFPFALSRVPRSSSLW